MMNFEKDKNRIFGLDLLRALAITFVVNGHGSFMLDNSCMEGFPFIRLIDGVDVFFVLSGFLIGSIILREFNKSTEIKPSDLVVFWKRRWFRTLPNYYLILLLNYLFVKHKIIIEDLDKFNIDFVFFLQNFKTPFLGFFWESWSLSIEEWFYIFTPVVIFLLLKIFRLKNAFLIATIMMAFLPLIYRINLFDPTLDHFTWGIKIRKTVLCRLDSISYGLFASWICCYFPSIWKKVKVPFFIIGFAIIIFIINYKQESTTFYKQTIYFSLLPFSIMLLIPLLESWKSSSGLISKAVQHISKISYSMYLINLALVAEVIRDNFASNGGRDGIFKYSIYLLIVVVFSSLNYKYFEKPMMDLRDNKFNFSFWKIKKS